MSPAAETRLFQLLVAIACLVPLGVGTAGVLSGPDWLKGVTAVPTDLDSHFRYLSGIFLGVGIGFASCIAGIAQKSGRFRLLAGFVILGGLARLLSLASIGAPSTGHIVGLAMELGVVPLLVAWQARIARLNRHP